MVLFYSFVLYSEVQLLATRFFCPFYRFNVGNQLQHQNYKVLQSNFFNFGLYRVSHMDSYKSKQLLWLCFLSQTLFPSDLCWKHVYILIFGIKYFSNFQWFGGIFHFLEKEKNIPNHRRDPLKNSKNQNVHIFRA